jgi:hypothetical protein
MGCYVQANKNDPTNFNILRDLSYLQLYLRQHESFLDTSRRGVELKPNLLLNWATYSFANYLTGNYEYAYKLMESCLNIGDIGVKEQEKHEMLLFQVFMLEKNNQFQQAYEHLISNKK